MSAAQDALNIFESLQQTIQNGISLTERDFQLQILAGCLLLAENALGGSPSSESLPTDLVTGVASNTPVTDPGND